MLVVEVVLDMELQATLKLQEPEDLVEVLMVIPLVQVYPQIQTLVEVVVEDPLNTQVVVKVLLTQVEQAVPVS